MTRRKAGWYWVKMDGEWYASQYRPGHIRGGDGVEAPWSFGILLSLEEAGFDEIGPRIPTPDEPWQAVPVEPTEQMTGDVQRMTAHWANDAEDIWPIMLAAAPKPEDE